MLLKIPKMATREREETYRDTKEIMDKLKMATREREETYKVAKEIMDKLKDTPWENKEIDDGWSIDDYRKCDDDECGKEQKSLTCPHCFQPLFAWSNSELNARMTDHIKKCSANPNKAKEEVKINTDKKISLPLWAL